MIRYGIALGEGEMTAPQQVTNGAPGRWVQHIYCSAMCDALTSYVFCVSAAKGGINEFVAYLITGGGNPGSGMELYSWSCHADSGLRPRLRFASQGNEENQLQRVPIPA